MAIMLNTVLSQAGLPLRDVCLVRHQDNRASRGRSPYELWRDRRDAFERYQSIQRIEDRPKFRRRYWVSFVGAPQDGTLFVGVFTAEYRGLLERDVDRPHRDGVDEAGTRDVYDLTLGDALRDLIGRLFIDWGPGYRAWVQHADRQNKPITELRTIFKEPEFPGFLNFMKRLTEVDALPRDWIAALRSTRGIYLLTCPKTKEQYVGSATGENGFFGRWAEYVQTGHGGNVALKSRDPSDYQVSILEVAGTACTTEEILQMEKHWKDKLQSREMGLNRN